MTNKLALYFILVICSLFTLNALAFYPKTDKDFSLLPAFCKAKLKPRSSAETALWSKRLGSDFGHTHHFCAGLHSYNWTLYNFPRNKEEEAYRLYALRSVLGEVKYMEDHVQDKKFVLFPSIYLLKAKAHADLGQTVEALSYYNKAIAANKKFIAGYLALAKYYRKLGSNEQALDTIKAGLKYKPSSKGLNRQLKELSP